MFSFLQMTTWLQLVFITTFSITHPITSLLIASISIHCYTWLPIKTISLFRSNAMRKTINLNKEFCMSTTLFFFSFFLFIVVDFVIHWNETAMGLPLWFWQKIATITNALKENSKIYLSGNNLANTHENFPYCIIGNIKNGT